MAANSMISTESAHDLMKKVETLPSEVKMRIADILIRGINTQSGRTLLQRRVIKKSNFWDADIEVPWEYAAAQIAEKPKRVEKYRGSPQLLWVYLNDAILPCSAAATNQSANYLLQDIITCVYAMVAWGLVDKIKFFTVKVIYHDDGLIRSDADNLSCGLVNGFDGFPATKEYVPFCKFSELFMPILMFLDRNQQKLHQHNTINAEINNSIKSCKSKKLYQFDISLCKAKCITDQKTESINIPAFSF